MKRVSMRNVNRICGNLFLLLAVFLFAGCKSVSRKVMADNTPTVVTKTLRVATQNLWGKPTAVVLDYFNRIDVDVLCAQECSNLSEAEIREKGLYVHTHTNNGQVECSIISRYPFSGVTPHKYGVYIDLGEGIVALVINCHGAYKPYGPYQLEGIAYGGYEPSDDVDKVFEMNREVRQDDETRHEIWRPGDEMFYRQGETDPDYCVLKFTAIRGRRYCDLKSESTSRTA